MPQRAPHNPNGGRPDKIGGAHVQLANRYIDGGWRGEGIVIPTAEGMARYLNISRKSLYAAEELSDTLEIVQRMQAEMVLNGALANEYNPTIAKLILSAKHGYIERSEVANTHEVVSNASEQVATDFNAYVKQKTIASELSPTQFDNEPSQSQADTTTE